MFSYLWEIETGRPYVITKANDIYSGLGAEAGLQVRTFVSNGLRSAASLHQWYQITSDIKFNKDCALQKAPTITR